MDKNSNLVLIHSPSHHEDLVNGLWNFFNTKYRVDFDVQFAGRSLRAHQLIMDIFIPPENLDRNRTMTCRRSNLDSLFEFMYKGEVAVPQGELDNLYWMAKKLGFNQLENAVDAVRSETIDAPSSRFRPTSRKEGGPRKRAKVDEDMAPATPPGDQNPDDKDLNEWHGLMEVLRANCDSPEKVEVDCDVGEASGEHEQSPDKSRESAEGSGMSRAEMSRLYRQSLPLVKCKFCCYETRDRRYYGRHYSKHHPDEKLPTCPKCKTPFFDLDGLANHMAKMHSILNYPRETPVEVEELSIPDQTTSSDPACDGFTAVAPWHKFQKRVAVVKGSRAAKAAAAEAAKQFRRRQPRVKCEHCDYETRDRRYYGNHYSRYHPEVTIPRCSLCQSPFFDYETLANHMAKVHCILDFQKPKEGVGVASKDEASKETSVSDSETVASETGETLSEDEGETDTTPAEARALARSRAAAKRYRSQLTRKQCDHCEFSTVSKECYSRHLRQNHPEVPVPICDLCGQSFFSESQLAEHKAKPNLMVHSESHRKRVAQLRAARRTRKDGGIGFKARKLATKERLRRSTECDFCDHAIGDKASYVEHLALRHPKETAFKCASCDWAFLDAESLAAHRIEHGGRCTFYHRCVHCPFKTEFATSLQRHLQTQHGIGGQAKPVQRNHKCTLCKFAGELPSHLRRHMETTHAVVKQFECHMCSYAASRSISLKKHIDKMHLKLKPWICEICAHPSSSKHNMDRHHLTHTGEKPFSCKYCDQAFADRNILKTHTRAKHTHEKPYICHICSWAFVALTHLKRHLKVHEPR